MEKNVWRTVFEKRNGGKRRYVIISGTCNGYCSTGRNGEYCRSGNSIGNRRTGSDFLDVDCGISWNGGFQRYFWKNPGSCLFCSDYFCTGIYGKCGTVQLDSVSISYCIWYTTDSGGDHYSGYRIVCICRRNFQNCKSYRDDCSNHGMFLYYRITDCNLCKL